jgi:two-component system NtrC family sensor kinase
MLLQGPELEEALAEADALYHAQLAQLLQPGPPLSALLAPLRNADQRLGVLVFYSGTHGHLFLPRDLPFAQALADLVATAITVVAERERVAALQRDLNQAHSSQAAAQAQLDVSQAQLLQSAKLAAIGELAASVAHEINNPLYAARNSLYLIAQDLHADASQRQFLDVAQGELARIARIITRMRDFYRPARPELESTALNTLVTQTVELVQTHLQRTQVEVKTDLAPDLPPIAAHSDQIRQVLLNLMLNACDAMPAGGTLQVTTQFLAQPSRVVVQIADTGVGIPADHLPRLFEPFYTTKPQGTGLGLTISAHIITHHGGQLTVNSTVGAGTTFTITLPVTPNR